MNQLNPIKLTTAPFNTYNVKKDPLNEDGSTETKRWRQSGWNSEERQYLR